MLPLSQWGAMVWVFGTRSVERVDASELREWSSEISVEINIPSSPCWDRVLHPTRGLRWGSLPLPTSCAQSQTSSGPELLVTMLG